MLHVRLDERIKDGGNAVLAAMGLSASDAVRLLYHRLIADQAFPLELKVPNLATRAAMADAEDILARRAARFAAGDDLIDALEAPDAK
jgi:DNA-damage-inducible protein J